MTSHDNFRLNDTVLSQEKRATLPAGNDLLALPTDVFRACAHASIQQPINSLSQIFCADKKLPLPALQIVQAPEYVEPLSVRWHAQQIGAALGAAADILAMEVLSRGAIKPVVAGACYDGLLRPVQDGEDNTQRLKNAAVGALTFGSQAQTSRYLSRFKTLEALEGKTIVRETLAAVPASFVTSAASGANKPTDFLMGAYASAFTGAGLGTVHGLSHWTHGVAELKSQTRELKKENGHLKAELRTDHLTGLNNRLGSDEALKAEFERAVRNGKPLSLIFGDLDGFKAVNDKLGHEAGDGILKHSGKQLIDHVRPYDHVARVGGDEFVVIMPDADNAAAQNLARRLEQALRVELMDGDHVIAVGASLGVVTRHPTNTQSPGFNDSTPEALRQRADAEMYRIKAERKGRI
jgi:diguanylate cyclase (GGDEF)-like protein